MLKLCPKSLISHKPELMIGKEDKHTEYELKSLWGQSEHSPEVVRQNLKSLGLQEKKTKHYGTRAMSQELDCDLI